MQINMKVIRKIIKRKVKGYFIIKVVINMRAIGKMIIEKEKEYFIIIMVIGKWEIF